MKHGTNEIIEGISEVAKVAAIEPVAKEPADGPVFCELCIIDYGTDFHFSGMGDG